MSGGNLTVGKKLRCPGLGMGEVVEIADSEFGRVAKLEFPHQDVVSKVPVSIWKDRLEPPASRDDMEYLLTLLEQSNSEVSRTWEQREVAGEVALRSNNPVDWAELLGAYAKYAIRGNAIRSIDKEIVRRLCELIAAELWATRRMKYENALAKVQEQYQNVIENAAVSV